jgi:small-conductance mechanosensitive channel
MMHSNRQGAGFFKTLASLVFGLLLAFAVTTASAQTSAPPALSQDQLDALVKAITTSVLEKLKSEQATTAKAPASAVEPTDADEPDQLAIFAHQAGGVLQTIPTFGKYLVEFRAALDDSPHGGLGRRVFLTFLLSIAGFALAAEALLRWTLSLLRMRLAKNSIPELGLRSLTYLGLLAGLDALGVVVVWLVNRGAVALWFSGQSLQDRFATTILLGILLWRLYSLVFRIVLRPTLPQARLCDMTDTDARRLYRLASGFVLLAILLRITYYVMVAMDAPAEAIAGGRVVVSPIVFLALMWLVVRTRDGVRQWLVGLGRVAPVVGFIGRHWVAVSIPFLTAVLLTQLYGAVTSKPNVPSAMILTLNVVIGLLIFETLLQAVVRRLDSQLQGFTPASDRPKLPDVIARCLRVLVMIWIVVALSRSWVVEVLGLVDQSRWEHLTRTSRAAGITLFIAFVAWELFRYATESYMQRLSQKNAGPADSNPGAAPAAGTIATRFDTLMPVIRVTVAVLIITIAGLIALQDLGVNIGPLLAGASVIGLAISFGSQTLVRDIVSGIFYLGDDAFRVGEYIDCGRAKGTVEGFTLRSIRLRHQNGQIHTIPFGSLGQITNFSRDWTVVKFTLPFARDTDLEKLRKAAKKIGAELMEDPELKSELIEPFKMQGIADVTDNSFIVRFKFMAKPGNPNAIQNKAVTRLLAALPDLGIALGGQAPPPVPA